MSNGVYTSAGLSPDYPVEFNQALSSKKALESSSRLHFEQGEDFVYLGVLCFPYWRKFNEN